jgi:hypothetical protein
MALTAIWRDDLDALQFAAGDGGALCMIHRLAFRRLIGTIPDREACLAWFAAHADVFAAAALDKMTRLDLLRDRNLHIDSRDVLRQMPDNPNPADAQANPRPAARCRVLSGP